MGNDFEVNGDFVICSKAEEQKTSVSKNGFVLVNKTEDGFQKLNKYRVERLTLKDSVDFPFAIGDIVIVASSGTVVNWKGNKRWLFRPEHVLAKIS